MLPAQRNKIDISVSVVKTMGESVPRAPLTTLSHPQSLSEEEQKMFRLYGKLPNRKDLLTNKLKVRCLEMM